MSIQQTLMFYVEFYLLKLPQFKQTAFTVPQNLIKNYFNDDKF